MVSIAIGHARAPVAVAAGVVGSIQGATDPDLHRPKWQSDRVALRGRFRTMGTVSV